MATSCKLFGVLEVLAILYIFGLLDIFSASTNGLNITNNANITNSSNITNNSNITANSSSSVNNSKAKQAPSLMRDPVHKQGYANFVKHENSYLNVSAAFSRSVSSLGDCGLLCATYSKGFSFNFRAHPTYHGQYVCEVLPTDKYNDSAKFMVNKPGFLHYSIFSPCQSQPCMNGATCKSLYEVDDFKCMCPPGFGGRFCEAEINECASSPCLNMGICTDMFGKFVCTCHPGFSGTRCQIVAPGALIKNGANVCSFVETYNFAYLQSYHVTYKQSYTYGCGWFGWWRCSGLRTLYKKAYRTAYRKSYRTNYRCCAGWDKHAHAGECTINIDECASGPCQHNATCVDLVNGYQCNCTAGFTGKHCQININECASNPCVNGGTCNDGVNGYTCLCSAGYGGDNCQTNINECASSPCVNGGTCNDGVNGYTCLCSSGYGGDNCQTNMLACDSNPCQNGGTCTVGEKGFTCKCTSLWKGDRCETKTKENNPLH